MASVMSYGTPKTIGPAPLGAAQPVEGLWYLQYKAFTNIGWAESATDYIKFGIDVTPPSAPLGLQASPTTDTALAGKTTAGTRMHFTWLTGDYDSAVDDFGQDHTQERSNSTSAPEWSLGSRS